METEAEQTDAARQRMERRQQCLTRLREYGFVGYRRSEAPGAGDQGEVAEFDLQGHGPSGNLGALDPVPGIAGNALELRCELIAVAQILVERPLRADRLVRPVRLPLALVNAAADPPVPFGRAAEVRLQGGQAPATKVRAGDDAQPLH